MTGLNQSQYMHSEALPLVNELIVLSFHIVYNLPIVWPINEKQKIKKKSYGIKFEWEDNNCYIY